MISENGSSSQRYSVLLAIFGILASGCHSNQLQSKQPLEVSRVPPAAIGGPERMDTLEGRVSGAKAGQQIVVYAKDGVWWIQPFSSRPFTTIQNDGTWRSSTHLGSDYAALLVDPGYLPRPRLETLPMEGNGVEAVVTVKGNTAAPVPLKVLHFSGYDWTVRAGATDRGGELNDYDSANAWTDDEGNLHLRMGERNGRWSCAEVSLTRSLGYGTYKLVVQDSAHLSPSGVLGIFTLDERLGEGTRVELDIELSQWGKPGSKNAQYVVQPYYVPVNIARFSVPPGVFTHVLRWEPGSASFRTFRGIASDSVSKSFSSHVFTSGIPVPAAETVHIDLYDFYHSKNGLQRPAEIVIEKFEYLP